MPFESFNDWNISGMGFDSGKSGTGLRLEGLSTFWWSEPNKFDLQIANDLFHKYERTKDPVVLGKINDFRLNVMKRSAEVELTRLEVPRTREEIEQDLDDPRTPADMKNEKLAYVLVTYLRNVEKLTEARRQEVEMVAADTKIKADALKEDVQATAWAQKEVPPPVAPKDDSPRETPRTPSAETVEKPAAPAVPNTVRVVESTLDREERISKEFIAAHKKEIDELIPKSKDPYAKAALPTLLANPTKENVRRIQTALWMKGEGHSWLDGRFWTNTLNALRAFVGEKKQEAVAKAPENQKSAKAPEKGKPSEKAPTERQKQDKAVADAVAEYSKKQAAETAVKEKELFDLQRNVVKSLTPYGNDVFVAEGSAFTRGYGASFRFDSQTKSWSWLDSPNPSDPTLKNKWQPVSGLEGATTNGVTKLPNFSFNEKAQWAVTAILAAQKSAMEAGIALWSPNTQSKLVQRIPA